MGKAREKQIVGEIPNYTQVSTEELIEILLNNKADGTRDQKLSAKATKFLRSKLGQKVMTEELAELVGLDPQDAFRIVSALELGKRYHNIKTQTLTTKDWDFANLTLSERQYGVHSFHHYTAKFIPQIPSRIIRHFSKGDDFILDPFVGSGTTLVESKLLGCHSYGFDTNPLAIKIAKAKTMVVDAQSVSELDNFLKWIKTRKAKGQQTTEHGGDCKLFEDSNMWFRDDVAYKIRTILDRIDQYSSRVKNFIEVGLSNLLKGMSNARMDSVVPVLPDEPIYIDKKHYYRKVNNLSRNIPVYGRVYSHVLRMKRAILEFNKETDDKLLCCTILGDARQLSKNVKQCNLVVTSPPYWSAQNYEKLHMLSFKLYGLKTEEGTEIGRSREVYLYDMATVFKEITKVLKGYFAIVIGEDTKHDQHLRLLKIAQDVGFNHDTTITRRISNQVSRAKQIKNEFIYILEGS